MEAILDTFGIDYRLLLLQVFNFGVLLLALWYFLYRPIVRLIEVRRAKIEQGVRDAEAAAAERDAAAEERTQVLTRAESEANSVVDAARQQAKETEASIVQEAQERAERTIADAQARAEEAKRQARAESREEVARLAVLGAEKVIREKHHG